MRSRRAAPARQGGASETRGGSPAGRYWPLTGDIKMEINGKKVVDAKRKAVIHITQTDTVKGATKDPGACAAARAAKRDIVDCLSARVHIGCVYIEHEKKWERYTTPPALRSEIIAFDRGGSFQPGEYMLNAPSPSRTEEGRKKYSGSDTSRNKPGNIPTKHPRKQLRIAKIKRHSVTGIRPRGANR